VRGKQIAIVVGLALAVVVGYDYYQKRRG